MISAMIRNALWLAFMCVILASSTQAYTVTISRAPDAKTVNRFAVFDFTSSPTGASFKCALDIGTAVACTSPWILMEEGAYKGTNLAVGSHSVVITACDNISVSSTCSGSQTATWTVVSVVTAARANDVVLTVAGSQMLRVDTTVPASYTGTDTTDKTPYLQGIMRIQCLVSLCVV